MSSAGRFLSKPIRLIDASTCCDCYFVLTAAVVFVILIRSFFRVNPVKEAVSYQPGRRSVCHRGLRGCMRLGARGGVVINMIRVRGAGEGEGVNKSPDEPLTAADGVAHRGRGERKIPTRPSQYALSSCPVIVCQREYVSTSSELSGWDLHRGSASPREGWRARLQACENSEQPAWSGCSEGRHLHWSFV